MASLYWGDRDGPLKGWTEFAAVPIRPDGTGIFSFTGGRAIPPEATHVCAKAVHQSMDCFETACEPLPRRNSPTFHGSGLRLAVLSDLHLTSTPWRIRKALRAGEGCDGLLLLGDLVNDGLPEQFQLLRDCIGELLPDTPVLPTAGNHDFPRTVSPDVPQDAYFDMESWLLSRAERLSCPCERDASGAYSARLGGLDVICLNAASRGRKFVFPDGAQLHWLERHLRENSAGWHVILCHAPLLRHNPQRKKGEHPPYLDRDGELQAIVDSCPNILFLSGHTHYSYNCPNGCVDVQPNKGQIYINAASVCPTTLKSEESLLPSAWTDATVTELYIEGAQLQVIARSLADGRKFARGYYVFAGSECTAW